MAIDLREEVRVILASESVYFGGMHLCYQLFTRGVENVRAYWIGVRMGKERSEALLGGCVERALAEYKRIVRGCITPCALEDAVSVMESM